MWVTYHPTDLVSASENAKFNCRIVSTEANARALLPWWYTANINPAGTALIAVLCVALVVLLFRMTVRMVEVALGFVDAALEDLREFVDADKSKKAIVNASQVPQPQTSLWRTN